MNDRALKIGRNDNGLLKKVCKVVLLNVILAVILTVPNLGASKERKNYTINIGDSTSPPLIDEKNKKAYITKHTVDGQLIIIDMVKNRIEKVIPIGNRPFKPILESNGKKLYIINKAKNQVDIVDIDSGKYTPSKITIMVQHPCDGGAVLSRKYSKLYVPHNKEGKVSVIDTKTDSLVKVVDIKDPLDGELTLGNDEATLLICHHNSGNISLINLDF
jgi:DNA-binding beta-propeller fold protein YncE